jgi:hypothetical protein
MKFSFRTELNPPPWVMPAVHTAMAGGGVVYMQMAYQPTPVTTAIVFVMGVSYGRILSWSRRKSVRTRKGRT